jgi:hypothetical protein
MVVFLLNDNNLHGTIPANLGNFSLVQQIDLSYNRLNGNIPSTFGMMTKVFILV